MHNLYRPLVVRRGFLRTLLDHRFKVAAAWLLILAAALAYSALAERRYRSEAKVFVRLGRESVKLDPTATTGQMLAVQESRDGEINSVFELLGSRVVLEKVVEELGEDRLLNEDDPTGGVEPLSIARASLQKLDGINLNPFRVYSRTDEAIEAVEKNLKISRPHKTHTLVLEYESYDPRLAQEVLDAVIRAGREAHLRVHVSPGSQPFFEEQSELFQAQLTQLEEDLRALKDEEGIADLAQQRELHLARIGILEEERSRAEASLASTLADLQQRQAVLETMPDTVVLEQTEGMPAVPEDVMREQLYELEIREKELLARYQPEHFLVQQVQEQIAMAREVLEMEKTKTQTTRGINESRRALEVSVSDKQAVAAGLRAQIESLDSQLEIARRRVQRLNDADLKLARLQRQIDIATDNYLTHMAKLEQARIDTALENANHSNLSVLQPPSHSVTPVRPNLAVNLGLGVLLATMTSLGMVLLSEQPIVEDSPGLTRAELTARETAPLDTAAPETSTRRHSPVAPGKPR